jgi:cell division septation protein DedD
MGKNGSEQIDRYHVGFFQSLTPASYVILMLITAGIIVGTGMFFFGGEEEEVTTQAQPQGTFPARAALPIDPAPAVAEVPPGATEPISSTTSTTGAEPGAVEVGEWRADVSSLMENATSMSTLEQNGAEPDTVQTAIEKVEPERQAQAAQEHSPEAVPSQAVVEPSEQVVSPAPAARPQGRWIAQLSVNKNPELARSWAKRLNELGANAYVLDRRTEKGDLHLLRMGFFTSREEARARAEEITGRTGLSGYSLLEASQTEFERFAKSE